MCFSLMIARRDYVSFPSIVRRVKMKAHTVTDYPLKHLDNYWCGNDVKSG